MNDVWKPLVSPAEVVKVFSDQRRASSSKGSGLLDVWECVLIIIWLWNQVARRTSGYSMGTRLALVRCYHFVSYSGHLMTLNDFGIILLPCISRDSIGLDWRQKTKVPQRSNLHFTIRILERFFYYFEISV